MPEDKKFVPENWDKEIEAVETVLYQHQAIAVTTQEEYDLAADLIKQANTTIAIVETKRKRYTVPLDEMKKAIMEKKGSIVKPLEDFVNRVKAMMVEFYKAEQAKIAAAQAEIDRKALEDAKANKLSEVTVPVLAPAPKTSRTGFSTATMKKVWKWKVVDSNKVPRSFLVIDEQTINEAVKQGVRAIDGLEIYEDVQTSIR